MLPLRLFEFILAITCLYVALNELIIPLIRKTTLFPMFRKEAQLEDELREAKQRRYEEDLKTQIKNEEKNEHPH
ncbi:MAG: hypothetical protein ABL970_12830 [Nitrospira sp.]